MKGSVITSLPLQSLTGSAVLSSARRQRELTAAEIHKLLCDNRVVHFLVADVGHELLEIPTQECFKFWKNVAKAHLSDSARLCLEDFPGGFCYLASHWGHNDDGAPIVVLETFH